MRRSRVTLHMIPQTCTRTAVLFAILVSCTCFPYRRSRRIASDIVLVAPLRRRRGERTARPVLIYILVEHQSEPDRLMPLRSLDYVVQISIM